MLHVHYGSHSLAGAKLLNVFVKDQKHADLCTRHIKQVNFKYGHVSGNEIGRCTFEFSPSSVIRRRPRKTSQIL